MKIFFSGALSAFFLDLEFFEIYFNLRNSIPGTIMLCFFLVSYLQNSY